MEEGLSIAALVIALAVALWQWRVTTELRAIHEELERIRYHVGEPMEGDVLAEDDDDAGT